MESPTTLLAALSHSSRTPVPDRPATPRPQPPAADTTAPALTRPRALLRRSRIRFRLSDPAAVRLVVRRRIGFLVRGPE